MQMSGSFTPHPVLETDYRGYHGMRTKDILGEPKAFWEDQRAGDLNNWSPVATSKFTQTVRFLLLVVGGPKSISRTDDMSQPFAERIVYGTVLTGLRQA